MEAGKPSRSAGIIAAHRAIESSKNHGERICHDPFARDFMPEGFTVIGKHEIPEQEALNLFKQIVPGFHEFFLARTRYIDDYLKGFIERELEQLVVLGAGYDSRAYRFDELENKIKVFEVDSPATQDAKKQKVKKIFNRLPDHITYISIDLQKDDLEYRLIQNGYNSSLKTLFIWEGVTMYIDRKAVDKTLLFISKNTGKGSSIIFDYTFQEVVDGTYDRNEAIEWLKITQNSNEPLLFGISNDHIEQFLTYRGFCNIVKRTNQYFKDNYFIGVNKKRESTPILAIVHAEINA